MGAKTLRLRWIVMGLALFVGACRTFVPLPAGEISREADGPTDEIILYLAFDPSLLPANEIPPEIRLRPLSETAVNDEQVAAYVRSHPERAGWTSSFLEIMRPEWLDFDGVRSQLGPDQGWAIWYADAARNTASDQRPLGSQVLELGTWLPDARLVQHLRARGYPVETAEVRFKYDGPDRVITSLRAPNLSVDAVVTLRGAPHPPWWKLPGVETIWSRPGTASAYEIVTYNDHRMREAEGVWQIEGTHLLAQAFANRLTGAVHVDTTEYAAGFRLRGALYKRLP